MGGCPRALVASLGITLGVLTGCGAGRSTAPPTPSAVDDDAITVASFDFAESRVLAELYAQALEGRGLQVRRAIGIGPRELVGPALALGLVELVPEYAGTALGFLSLGRVGATADAATHPPGARAGGRRPSPHGAGPGPGAERQHVRRHPRDRRAGAPAAAERPRRRRARPDLRWPARVPDPPAVPRGAGAALRGALRARARPRRRRAHDATGARAGRHRRRPAVHHRPRPRHRRPGGPRGRPGAAAGRERHAPRADRGARPLG